LNLIIFLIKITSSFTFFFWWALY